MAYNLIVFGRQPCLTLAALVKFATTLNIPTCLFLMLNENCATNPRRSNIECDIDEIPLLVHGFSGMFIFI